MIGSEGTLEIRNTKKSTSKNIPRRRGRPRKESTDASTELQRDKLRRTQKAFRERKEQYVAGLEDRCTKLEDVIEEMTNAFLSFSDGLIRSESLRPETGEELKTTIERFLVLSKKAAKESNDGESSPGDAETKNSRSPEDDNFKTSPDTLDGTISQYPGTGIGSALTQVPQASVPAIQQWVTPMATSTVPREPYLYSNYTLWGRPITCTGDGSSAITYILAGRNSFACRLYFETIALVLRSLHGELPASIASSMFRYKEQYKRKMRIRAMLDGILNMLLHGTSQGKSGQLVVIEETEEEDRRVKREIVRQIEMSGGSESEYLSTWQVEKYLRGKWKLAIDAGTVRVQPSALLSLKGEGSDGYSGGVDGIPTMAWPTMIPGFVERGPSVWNAGSLVEKLRGASVTIGEGPRWHVESIDEAVEAFLVEKNMSG
ncbi:hypothetical protein BDZ45DRAFT_721300 [Acephala macrosclerotiorum]|nr:hypothetical protein BDZ45DRAFT_721300 [Acephala macrosclerotiorum]